MSDSSVRTSYLHAILLPNLASVK